MSAEAIALPAIEQRRDERVSYHGPFEYTYRWQQWRSPLVEHEPRRRLHLNETLLASGSSDSD